jgi:hypothetical protein
MILASRAVKTASKAAVNLRSRWRIRNRKCRWASSRSMRRVARRLGQPRSGRLGGTQDWVCGMDPYCTGPAQTGHVAPILDAISTRLFTTFAAGPAGHAHPATDNLARLGVKPARMPLPPPTSTDKSDRQRRNRTLIFGDRHLPRRRALAAYSAHYNTQRPHRAAAKPLGRRPSASTGSPTAASAATCLSTSSTGRFPSGRRSRSISRRSPSTAREAATRRRTRHCRRPTKRACCGAPPCGEGTDSGRSPISPAPSSPRPDRGSTNRSSSCPTTETVWSRSGTTTRRAA